ncbi:MAG: phenylalanine--tRNA ligase subunit alpha, partial [Bacteroidales bacterium]|nr:phenylalanine--tRNA ligase subunit alpha [Bacteroidales bacterium]
MKQRIKQSIENLKQLSANTLEELEQLRIQYLGKKGVLNDLFAQFKTVPNEEKREMGSLLNELKTAVQTKIETLRDALEAKIESKITIDDLTKPAYLETLGSRHPISLVRNEITNIFAQIGYTVEEGPEIEDDWHVFSALNFPPEHPARDMQDTFFIEDREDGNNTVLRTHTSSVQVRTMEKQQPPIRIIAPGRVFRNEAISARAH